MSALDDLGRVAHLGVGRVVVATRDGTTTVHAVNGVSAVVTVAKAKAAGGEAMVSGDGLGGKGGCGDGQEGDRERLCNGCHGERVAEELRDGGG